MSSQRFNRKRNAGTTEQTGLAQHENVHQQELDSGSSPQHQEGDEYAMKRQRNNAAVNRTRQKKRIEQANTSQRVKELREENVRLERTLDTMRRELALLKEMVVVCAAKGDQRASGSS